MITQEHAPEDEHIRAVMLAARETSKYELTTRTSRSCKLKTLYIRRFLEFA
jgi:hypothetical protein